MNRFGVGCVLAVLCALSWTPLGSAADFAIYRGFQLGGSLATAAKQAETRISEAKTIHQRPALIQELEWRPPYTYASPSRATDPVRDVLLRFYNGDLFQMVVTYNRQDVEGLTEADMVNSISAIYGVATKPKVEIPYRSNYGEAAPVLARWEDPEYSYNLVRTGDGASFVLLLGAKRLDALAQAAMREAIRLDTLEAPQRAIEQERDQEAQNRLLLEKARTVNLPNFRP